ncbi:MAG: GNAT family N-acetyltransferase [Burkholderiaceae bacterium]|nr:GNAT family N-acetyltransferase [Roseateles sp.]MBV8469669.1 GNAT family N-acetyltransferase [Burkholderiaceae bacterium]
MLAALLNDGLRDLAQQAEDAGLNASAPPQQELLDGWLIRLSPGKAKRSRCVNALAQGRTPLTELLARCQHSFKNAGLPLVIRITPFSHPADLDQQLAARGWYAFDAADVMLLPELWAALRQPEGTATLQALDAADYAELVGQLRQSTALEIQAHAQRMRLSPVRYQGYALRDAEGALLACGQIAQEQHLVGLYDIFTPTELRGRGHARQLCQHLLMQAHAQGARQAYLQVGSDNEVALRLYRSLGFIPAYRYHYRSADPSAY